MWSASTVELSLASTSRSRAGGAHRPGARACEEKRPPREWIALGIPDGFALALPCESLQLRVRVKRLSYGLRRESCEEVTGIPLGVRGRVQLNEHARTRKDALRVVTGRASGSRGQARIRGSEYSGRMAETISFNRLILRVVLRQVSPMVIRVVSVSDQMKLPEFHESFAPFSGGTAIWATSFVSTVRSSTAFAGKRDPMPCTNSDCTDRKSFSTPATPCICRSGMFKSSTFRTVPA
jgi:hypothetical protein